MGHMERRADRLRKADSKEKKKKKNKNESDSSDSSNYRRDGDEDDGDDDSSDSPPPPRRGRNGGNQGRGPAVRPPKKKNVEEFRMDAGDNEQQDGQQARHRGLHPFGSTRASSSGRM